jgi:hypothetical protein
VQGFCQLESFEAEDVRLPVKAQLSVSFPYEAGGRRIECILRSCVGKVFTVGANCVEKPTAIGEDGIQYRSEGFLCAQPLPVALAL